MGQGGQFQIVNYTPYVWVKTHEHSYQMNDWTLPAQIPAWSSQQVYVEFSGSITETTTDDGADTTYAIQGTGSSLTLSARGNPSFYLQAQMGSTQSSLGWNQDGTTTFALAGNAAAWSWAGMNGSSWMQDNLSLLGNRTLREIAIPGAHDAGMSTNSSGGTAAASAGNTIAQSLDIGGQLAKGIRFFDIRPVISGNQYLTGHYSDILDNSTWQGENGQSIQSIVDEINTFTSTQKELIILDLSHDYDTDSDYVCFNLTQWQELFNTLKLINHLFVSSASDLTQLTLSEFIGGGTSAVVIIMEESPQGLNFSGGSTSNSPPGIHPLGYVPTSINSIPGVYPHTSFSIVNEYSSTNDLGGMVSDQFSKMSTNANEYFLLSWTLTQSNNQAVATSSTGTIASIAAGALTLGPVGATAAAITDALNDTSVLTLGSEAENALMSNLLGQTHAGFPNIILTDNIQDTRSAVTAMCLHWAVGQYVPVGSYLQNSSDVTVTLQAQCKNASGISQSSSLSYTLSEAATILDISNSNGVLQKNSGNGIGLNPTNKNGPYIPAGSYQNSSSDIVVTISAICTNAQGQSVPSLLSYTSTAAASFADISISQFTPVPHL